MNSITIKGVIVERLSMLADNSQSKPISHTTQTKQTNRQAGLCTIQRNYLASLIKWGLMCAGLLTLPLSGYAAISATTSKTIQGTAPYLTSKSTPTTFTMADALSVQLPDGTSLSPGGSSPVTLPPGTPLSAIKVGAYITYNDGDTDGADSLLPIPGVDGLSYTWTDTNSGAVIASTAHSTTTLTTPCGGYTLTITATNLAAKSQYGDPIKGISHSTTAMSRVYQFVADGITHFRTGSTDTTGGAAAYYTAAGFDRCKLVQAGLTFPTTAFPSVTYQVVGVNSPTAYRYQLLSGPTVISDPSAGITSAAANISTTGEVTITGQPGGPITIKLLDPISGTTVDAYTFVITKFGRFTAGSYETVAEARTACSPGTLVPFADVTEGNIPTYGSSTGRGARREGRTVPEWMGRPGR